MHKIRNKSNKLHEIRNNYWIPTYSRESILDQ